MTQFSGNPGKIVYIAGWGRSGSTILGAILGEFPGCFAVGELRYLFHPEVSCGCGEPAAECAFWSKVVDRAEDEIGSIDRTLFIRHQRKALAPKRVPSIVGGTRSSELDFIRTVMRALYQAVAYEAGAQTIIDGSKHPGDAAVVGSWPESRLVHLVRDPRASAYSWAERRRTGQQSLGYAEATARWIEWSLLCELVAIRLPRWHKAWLRYEDLANDPERVVRGLGDLLDLAIPEGLMVENRVRLASNHMIGSNPAKFRVGEVTIEPDLGWQADMDPVTRFVVVAGTLPLMIRYGYLSNVRS